MNSLEKYYSFLKEKNIVDVNSLKEFICKEEYKLKSKEDDNLIVIYNDQFSNIDDELVRFFNGVIIDKSTLKVVCYTFDKCLEENNIHQNLINTEVTVQPVYEGTLVRVYYYNNKWNISTKKMIDAYNSKWASNKSFGEMFAEIFGNSWLEHMNDFPSKDYCYSFLMGHIDNNILQIDKNYLIHLNTVDLVNNKEVDFRYVCNTRNINHILNYDSYKFIKNDYESIKNYIEQLKNDQTLNSIGYMLINNGIRQKFMKNNFTQIRELWGNTNNRLFRYLNLRKNPENLKKYLDIFPKDKKEFLEFEHYLMNIATFILNIYRNRHITKQITKVPFYLRDTIYKIHGLYLQTKNKVNFNDINVLLHNLDEKKFCHIINNIEKDKKNISETEKEKNQQVVSQIESVQNSNMETESQTQNIIESTMS